MVLLMRMISAGRRIYYYGNKDVDLNSVDLDAVILGLGAEVSSEIRS